jgi:hypothetical protein
VERFAVVLQGFLEQRRHVLVVGNVHEVDDGQGAKGPWLVQREIGHGVLDVLARASTAHPLVKAVAALFTNVRKNSRSVKIRLSNLK